MDEQHARAIGRLTDMLGRLDPHIQPFLYYLPKLLTTKEFSAVNPEHAVTFADLALEHDTLPVIKDALKILNRIVNPEDGKLMPVAADIFYENQSFFWNELGGHTKASDIVMHVFNKVIFLSSLGKKSPEA